VYREVTLGLPSVDFGERNMTAKIRRPVGRPKKSVLSREAIIAEAFELADQRGTDFTLAALARRLDVQPSALHHYFDGRSALIAAMRGDLALRIGDQGFDEKPWWEAIVPWAHAYFEALGSRPGVIAAMATSPLAGEPESVKDYERIIRAFLRDGFPEERVVPALVAIESFIIGSALDNLTPDDNMAPAEPADAPALAHAESIARSLAQAGELTPARASFTFGLSALIAGLRALQREE
jgi:AcrR family transcriptional regulator